MFNLLGSLVDYECQIPVCPPLNLRHGRQYLQTLLHFAIFMHEIKVSNTFLQSIRKVWTGPYPGGRWNKRGSIAPAQLEILAFLVCFSFFFRILPRPSENRSRGAIIVITPKFCTQRTAPCQCYTYFSFLSSLGAEKRKPQVTICGVKRQKKFKILPKGYP